MTNNPSFWSALRPLILIVDDQPPIHEALVESLNSRNFRTAVARDGQQGLHYAGLLRPDLVLIDIALPDMDGIEVCRSLKANQETREVPVIFVIAPDDGDKLLAGFEAGGIDYLIKPLQIEDVITRLKLRLRLHGLQQQVKTQDNGINKCRDETAICKRERCEVVVAHQRAKQQLRKQKGQISSMSFVLDRLNEAIFLTDPQAGFRFRYVNDKACQSLGYTRGELLNMFVSDIDPSVNLAVAQKIDEQICKQVFVRMETVHRRKDGHLFPVEISGTEIEYNGQKMGLAIVRDITERKHMEELLKMKEFALDHASDAIFLIDANECFIYLNEEACRSLDYSRDELIGLTPFDIDPDISAVCYQSNHEQILVEGSITLETRHRRRDGSVFPVEIRFSRFDFQDQTLTMALVRDISERRDMEAQAYSHLHFFESMDKVNRAIQRSNDFETVLNNVLDAILSIFNCDRAFLCYPCDPEADSWGVPLERTRPEYPGALALGLDTPMDADVATLFRLLLDSEGPVTNGPGNQHPLPKAVSEQFCIKSMMSMSIHPKGDKLWDFGIHQCSHARVWMPDEKKLFQEIGRRLADGLTGLLAYRDIQESEQKFRNLAESLPDYISRYDLQARKTYANPMLEQLLGGNAEAWLGKTPMEVYPGGEFDEYQAKLEGVIKTGKCDNMALKTQDGSGAWCYHHIHFVPECGPNGEIIGALTIGRDVTRKRQLEMELIRREREFRTLAENSPNIIARYDRDCRRIYINQSYKVVTNTTEAEILGKTPMEYWRLAVPEAHEFTGILQRVIETRTQERIEVQLVDAKGLLSYFSMHLVPEFDQNNQVISILSVSIDLTELKITEQRRGETSKQAERQLREFSAHLQAIREEEKLCIAREIHDNLGGTLTALKMDLNWLMDELSASKEAISFLNHVESMSQLLDNAVVVTRRVITDLRPTILDDFGLPAALEWQAGQFRKRTGIQCRVVCDEREPYELDKTQTINLYRIFQESLTNIARHSGASSVEVELKCESGGFILTISDNGCGLPEGHTISPTSYGMLGMRERTEQLGGRINFYSSSGGGFSVTVMLPQPTDNQNEGKS
jgi:PAS domain S-box-containing protein